MFSLSGDLPVSDTLNSVGGYDVTGFSGTVSGPNGGAITALVTNPTKPVAYDNGSWIFDNVVFPSGPWVDISGILFAAGGYGYFNRPETTTPAKPSAGSPSPPFRSPQPGRRWGSASLRSARPAAATRAGSVGSLSPSRRPRGQGREGRREAALFHGRRAFAARAACN